MKILITFILLFTQTVTIANNHFSSKASLAHVEDAFCGEMDPMVVGDVCIVFISLKNKKLGLLMDFDDFLSSYDPETLIGSKILFDKAYSFTITNRYIINTLRKYDEDYFYLEYLGKIKVSKP